MNVPRYIRVRAFGLQCFSSYYPTNYFCNYQGFRAAVLPWTCGRSFNMVFQRVLYRSRVVVLMVRPVLFRCFSMGVPLMRFPVLGAIFILFLFYVPRGVYRNVTGIGGPSLFPLYQASFILVNDAVMTSTPTCDRVLFFGISVLPYRAYCLSGSRAYGMYCLGQGGHVPASFSGLFGRFPMRFGKGQFGLISIYNYFVHGRVYFFLFVPRRRVLR